MFEKFKTKFDITSRKLGTTDISSTRPIPSNVASLFNNFSGATFNHGLYRIHTLQSSQTWAIFIAEYFDDFQNKIIPFGFDWMGRQYCLNTDKMDFLLMFDPSTGEYFELEQTIEGFHEIDLYLSTEDMLSNELFTEFMHSKQIKELQFTDCIGFSKPLFLGGADELSNLEIGDQEVYWHIQNQIWRQIKDWPDGTPIGEINIE